MAQRSLRNLLSMAAPSPDLTESFAESVRSITNRLPGATADNVAFHRMSDYSVSHFLEISLDDQGCLADQPADAPLKLKLAISAVVPAWTAFVLARTSERGWRIWQNADASAVVSKPLWTHLSAVLAEPDRDYVPADELSRPVPGKVTELDGAPATVHDLLFCEVC